MKKILIPLLILGASLSTTFAFAQAADPVIPTVPVGTTISAQSEGSATISSSKLSRIQATGAKLISQRLTSLNSLTTQINASNLTSDQKTPLTTSISTQISGLTSLGTQISSAADASSTKILVQSIMSSFRIYSVFIPQIKLEKRINELQNHILKLNAVFTKVQANINIAKTKGKDTTAWQTNLTAAQTTVGNDTTQLSTLMTNISAMKPSDYPTTSKTIISATNTGIKSVVSDLKGISMKVKNPNAHTEMNANASSTVTH